ncbi:cytochrome C assembly family protein [Tautonia plasticadhaerens]|uniref:Cytochrome c biogenesis protein CcsA n=1 Tax=Tautonia plasticadhaerens TaxID=2527974 RepID=A0A518H6W8_9BACT|nr:cytochrome c biogenesis protein CcsA [Tautonia plasticadhaerens]QDV36603.1 Cytochrome c biogenesis protein CcsA [Tautonia plasticadhaerens]
MLDRLSVLCFAGTYGLALVADLARLVVRVPVRWHLTVGLTLLGWLVHTAFLGNLAWRGGQVPIATAFHSLLVLAWILAAIDLYLTAHAPKPSAVGVFVLPLVLALLGAAVAMPAESRADWTRLGGWETVWGTAHGVLLLLGAVSTFVAFAAGLMYLAQADRLKRKRSWRIGVALPSLEQSERWNRAAITVAFPMLTAGLAIGVGLNASARREGDPVLDWSDPKVISASALWICFAVLLHVRYRPEWRGKRVMLLTALAFGFLTFTLVGVDLLLPTAHGVARGAADGRGPGVSP